MERIDKEIIRKGVQQKIIAFSFGTEGGLPTAHIGDNSFFISDECGRTIESFSESELIDMVYETINDEPINDENEEQAGEFLYYKAFLMERVK